MSFEDDKSRWTDAAHRILNLQQSSSDGTFSTNFNAILDELNSLDYATSIVENEEVSTKTLRPYTWSIQISMLNKCTDDAVDTLANICQATNVDQCMNFGDSLLGKDGVLVRLCRDESQDTDILCSTVQCVANVCMRSSNGLCMEDQFITSAFKLLLDLLQASSPKLCGTEIEHFRLVNSVLRDSATLSLVLGVVQARNQHLGPLLAAMKRVTGKIQQCSGGEHMPSPTPNVARARGKVEKSSVTQDHLMGLWHGRSIHYQCIQTSFGSSSSLISKTVRKPEIEHFRLVNSVLRALPHVLVLGCSGQNQHLGPLLAALKNLCFVECLATNQCILRRGTRNWRINLQKKKRRPNNKKSKQTTAPSTPKQITVGSSAMDALTPTFAACNLSYSVPKEPACKENQSVSSRPRYQPRHTTHYTASNNIDGSGAESSGYHSASSHTASSDSEYSDSEVGQTARLRSITSKVRLNVLLCLQAVIKSTDKKVLFGYWSSFVPDNTVSSSWSLFTTILKDPTPKGRAGGVAVLMDLLDGSRQFLVAAEDREQHSSSPSERPFTSFSCLSLLVLNSPYNRLKEGLLSKSCQTTQAFTGCQRYR
ncbi:hypothetical protein OS493_038985 [Desmophyllum pertusum]|uniref:DUF4042 domain-containing protein n=1 Tax=Desmophyllum pertusum TaxID=174260 RepID=A0A9X0CZM2_9CNID|nr:hypothetical protein OS493_038985 [Desmophyllum pertusum]